MTIKTTAASAVLAIAMASTVLAGNIPSKTDAQVSGNIPSVAKTESSKDTLGNIPSKLVLTDMLLALVGVLI
jgi:hypothetical protein